MSEKIQLANAQARVGQTLRGKWRLEALIGVGGMAAVYAGVHRNGMRGAVKLLHTDLARDEAMCERFLREGYAANRCEHPGVVRVLDDDKDDDGSVFLVMELLEGDSLEKLAARRAGDRLAVSEVLAIADAVLDVLAVAHRAGIVHRDLKPENLFVTTGGELKVLDFGLAGIRELQGKGRRTVQGLPMGTPAFMAPEQASGQWERVGPRTDLWALGATMFTLLSGRTVHEAETVVRLLREAMGTPARSLATVLHAPMPVVALVDRALSFDIDKRYDDAAAMQAGVRVAISVAGPRVAIADIRGGPPVEAVPARLVAAGEASAAAPAQAHWQATVVSAVAPLGAIADDPTMLDPVPPKRVGASRTVALLIVVLTAVVALAAVAVTMTR